MESGLYMDFKNRMLEQQAYRELARKRYENLPEASKEALEQIRKTHHIARRRFMGGGKDFSDLVPLDKSKMTCPKCIVNFFRKHPVK